jgi:hypothetical protein
MEPMPRTGSRIAARLRRRFGQRVTEDEAGKQAVRAPAAALRSGAAGLGEPPSSSDASAGEAELDTLRGELVRELDRLAEGDDGSGSFRRIAS